MSHIVQIKTQIRDLDAVQAACRRLGLADPVLEVVRLFSSEVSGLAVRLPGWKYPVVCQLDTGQVEYDDFGGRWGALGELHKFLQTYAVERTKLEARRQGHTVTEQQLPHGSIKLTIQVAGGAA